jgi:lipopolysaccharide transport system ATP-binding protein
MSDTAIRIEHVYKKFRKGEVYNSLRDLLPALTGRMFQQEELSESDKREFWAVQDLSFEVKAGESFGIIGHNGAGKSTALKMLSRIMKPTKGRMVVSGRLSALIEVSAGFHADLTGRENIFLNGAILGMSRREIQSKLDQIIAFSGIEEFIDTPVKRYSSGMYARLGFSVAASMACPSCPRCSRSAVNGFRFTNGRTRLVTRSFPFADAAWTVPSISKPVVVEAPTAGARPAACCSGKTRG